MNKYCKPKIVKGITAIYYLSVALEVWMEALTCYSLDEDQSQMCLAAKILRDYLFNVVTEPAGQFYAEFASDESYAIVQIKIYKVMTAKEFFEKYDVNFYGKVGSCETCALMEGAKCGQLFNGCPLPGFFNFKEREK